MISLVGIFFSCFQMNITKIPKEYKSFIHSMDNFDDYFSEIHSRKNIVEELIDINDNMHNSHSFKFVEMSATNIYTYALNRSEQKNIKAIYCGEEFFELFDIHTENNTYFEKNDFTFNSDRVSLIIGSNLKSEYSIGDTIRFYRQGFLVDGIVIGVLESNQFIEFYGNVTNIDDCFIIPFPSFTKEQLIDEETRELAFRVMLDRNNGIVIPNASKATIQAELNDYTQKHNLPDYSLSVSYNERNLPYYILILICLIILIPNIIMIMKRLTKYSLEK